MKIKILFLIFFPLFLFSCKKETESLSTAWTQNVFQDQDWVLTKSFIKRETQNPNAVESDIVTLYNTFNDLPACHKDDVFRFNSDKRYYHLLGPNECGGPTEEHISKWEILVDNKIKISHFTPSGQFEYSLEWQLNTFDENHFMLYKTNQAQNNVITLRYEIP